MLEAVCLKCGDTFVPADELDLEHFVRTSDDEHQGEPCGGAGVILGEWRTVAEARRAAPCYCVPTAELDICRHADSSRGCPRHDPDPTTLEEWLAERS